MEESFLSWQEAFAVGHRTLDIEHRQLLDLINEISRAAGVRQLLRLSNAFYLASISHFRHENSVMRDILDGAYLLADDRTASVTAISKAINDHCAEHARALIKLEHLLQPFTVKAKLPEAMLASELRAWFLDHTLNHDAHLKDIFNGSSSGCGQVGPLAFGPLGAKG